MYTIPIQNIYYILCYAWGIGDLRGRVSVGVETCSSLADLLVHVLLNATENLLKRGMSQDYIIYADEVEGIRGKIDIAETIRRGLFRQAKTFCHYDELSSDVLVNQIISTTLMNAMRIEGLSKQNENRIARILRRLPRTRRIRITAQMFRNVRLHRNNRYYKLALDVCYLLHQSLLPAKGVAGNVIFRDIMNDERQMNRIFEKFLMNFYKQECSQFFPEVSRSHIRFQLTPFGMTFAKSTDDAYAMLPVMETDVTLYNPQTKRKIILDAKFYKDTLVSRYGEKGKIRRDHLSQILTYVMNQENKGLAHTKETMGILVYPTVNTELDVSYVYKNTRHVIRVCTINLNQDWVLIERRLKEIIEDQG